MSLEAFFAVVLAKVLGIAGIGGLIAGLFIRNLGVALAVGAGCGVVGTLVLTAMRATSVEALSWFVAIGVGLVMSALGWLVYGRKRGH